MRPVPAIMSASASAAAAAEATTKRRLPREAVAAAAWGQLELRAAAAAAADHDRGGKFSSGGRRFACGGPAELAKQSQSSSTPAATTQDNKTQTNPSETVSRSTMTRLTMPQVSALAWPKRRHKSGRREAKGGQPTGEEGDSIEQRNQLASACGRPLLAFVGRQLQSLMGNRALMAATMIIMLITGSFIRASEAVDCFKCSSRNGSNPACEDPFHNLNTTRVQTPVLPDPQPQVIYHTPCYAGRKGKEGLFPASACIKLTGTFEATGETLVVRHCALDSGTLTQDTELARMSHCGKFQFEGDLLRGCVLACPEDACNSAMSRLGPAGAAMLVAAVLGRWIIAGAPLQLHRADNIIVGPHL